MNTRPKRERQPYHLPRAAAIAVYALPAAITVLFYVLHSRASVMDWVSTHVSAPARGVLGLFSSVFPFSLMEILIAAAVIWAACYIVRTITVAARRGDFSGRRGSSRSRNVSRRHEKLAFVSRRLLTVIIVALYIWSLFCWLWNSGYHAPGFAAKYGFAGGGVSRADLTATAWIFAAKANELAPLVARDEDGGYIGDRRDFFSASTSVFDGLTSEFPSLGGRLYKPKPMLFSWLMSRTGYTGIYFALTGESNINTSAPLFLMPATVAHELAHQRGVFAEDEANFAGIAACVTSGNMVYEYAGSLMGLMYLLNALATEDIDAWAEIGSELCAEVNRDWQDNYEYWEAQKKVETGVGIIDSVLTAVTEKVSDTVDSVYDGYLKSQNQELGLRSYGACVDLLVEFFHNS